MPAGRPMKRPTFDAKEISEKIKKQFKFTKKQMEDDLLKYGFFSYKINSNMSVERIDPRDLYETRKTNSI